MEKQFEKLTSVETLQERVQKKPIMELKRNPDPDEDEGVYLEIDVGVTLSELFNFLDKKQNSVIKRDKRLAEDFEDKLSDSLFGLHDRSEDYDSGYGSERFSPRPDDMPGLEAHERAFMEADSEDMAVEDDLMEIREKLSFLKQKRPEEYTEEDRKLFKMTVIGFFRQKGYGSRAIENNLPIKIRDKAKVYKKK